MRKLTYFLLILFLATTSLSLFRRKEMFAAYTKGQQAPKVERGDKAKRLFPTADINEPDSDGSEKGRAKKKSDSVSMPGNLYRQNLNRGSLKVSFHLRDTLTSRPCL